MASDFQIRWKRHRQRLKVLQLDQYPSTPAGYYSGYYPGSGLSVSNKIRYKYALQKLPELNQYPLAPADIVELITQPTRKTKRTLRITPELNQYTPTPQDYYSGFYPGSKLAESQKTKRKVTLRSTPELDSYPAAPVQAPVTAFDIHFEKTKNLTKRKRINVELNQYPQTQQAYYEGYYPGSGPVKANKIQFKRKHQEIELDEYPQPPLSAAILPAYIAGVILRARKTRYNALSTVLSTYEVLTVAAAEGPARWSILLEIKPNYQALVELGPTYEISDLSSDPNFKAIIDG